MLDRIGAAFSDNPSTERGESDLRAKAEANTRRMLEGMLRVLGYTSVNVTFNPPPV